MTRRIFRVSTTVAHYTLLLILLFSIPLATFVVVNALFLSRIVEKNLVDSYASELDRITAYFDQEVGRLRPVAQAIHRSEDLRSFWLKGSAFDSGGGLRALREFAVANGFFESIVLHSHHRDYLLTNHGSYPPDLFFVERFVHEGWNSDNITHILDSINSEQSRLFLDSTGEGYSIGVFSPIPIVGRPVRGFVAFFVSYRLLDRLLESQAPVPMRIYVFDEDNAVVYRSYRDEASRAGAIGDYLDQSERGRHTATIDIGGEEYLLAVDTMELIDWSVVALSPSSVATSPVIRLRTILMVIVLGLVGLGVPLIYAIIGHLYRPLRHLADSLGSEALYESSGDEWERVETFVHDLRSENVKLRSFSSFSERSAASRAYLRLLRGQFTSFDDFRRLATFAEDEVTGAGCFVAVVGIDSVAFDRPASKQEMVDVLNDATSSEFSFVAVDALHRSIIPILVQEKQGPYGSGSPSRGTLEYLRGLVHNRLDATLSIGVGGRCLTAADVRTSLTEARSALEYSFVFPPGSIIAYSEIESRDTSLAAPPRALVEAFQRSVSEADVEEAGRSLRRLVDELQEKEYSIRAVKIVMYELIGSAWEELARANLARERQGDLLDQLRLLDHSPSLGGSVQGVLEVTHALLSEAHYDDPHLRAKKLVGEIAEYLDTHYDDPSLTLTMVAERFGLSASNLTHHFKTKIGTTVIAYLDRVRLSHARRLLTESDKQVSEIVQEIGYFDVSNFIRKFKKHTGKTPTQYRATIYRNTQ